MDSIVQTVRPRECLEAEDVQRRCPICENDDQSRFVVQVNQGKPGMTQLGRHEVFMCKVCRFLHNPGNVEKDLNEIDHTSGRVGREDKPGREYAFAARALEILRPKRPLDALVFGPGVSLDHAHIGDHPSVASSSVADIRNYQGLDNFLDIRAGNPDQRKFDLVIASEVIEHFEDPVGHYGSLLDYVSDDGMCIAGTNFVAGMPVTRLIYPYTAGHSCMWSEGSIHLATAKHGFKSVIFLSTIGGTRKRIIVSTKSLRLYAKLLTLFERKKVFL